MNKNSDSLTILIGEKKVLIEPCYLPEVREELWTHIISKYFSEIRIVISEWYKYNYKLDIYFVRFPVEKKRSNGSNQWIELSSISPKGKWNRDAPSIHKRINSISEIEFNEIKSKIDSVTNRYHFEKLLDIASALK